MFHNVDSRVQDGRLADAHEDRPYQYGADMHRLYQYINQGVRSQGGAMHFANLKRKYEREFGELKSEHWGQRELL